VARVEPSDTRAYHFLAGCCIEQERYEEAADAIKKIVDDACLLFVLLGHSCCDSGQYKEAVEAYKQAIQINPNKGVTHYLLAETYVKMGDKDLALEQYEILKTIDEDLANELHDSMEQ
jgi:cytochrome c-type biogenesis protein CcmH/NrfG